MKLRIKSLEIKICQSKKEQRKNVSRAKELLERKEAYKIKKENLGNRNSYSKTDTDAPAMMMKDKITIRPAYNEGITVEKGFVLNYDVSAKSSDSVNFIPLMDGTIENLGKMPKNAHGDAAYGNEENWSFLEEKNINNFLKYGTYRKEKSKKWRAKKLRFEDFKYNNEGDFFLCKNNKILSLVDEFNETTATGHVRHMKQYKAPEGICTHCPFRALCTKSTARTLDVSWNREKLRRQARENLESDKGKDLRKRRGNEIESVFGDGKMNKSKGRYLLRGLAKVNIEAGLYYISHNIRKMPAFFIAVLHNQCSLMMRWM